MQQSRDYCVLAYSTWHIVLSEIKLQVTIHESLHYLSNTYISRSLQWQLCSIMRRNCYCNLGQIGTCTLLVPHFAWSIGLFTVSFYLFLPIAVLAASVHVLNLI